MNLMDWQKVSCAVWGHHVDNHVFAGASGPRQCRCGAGYLDEGGALTRVRHTLSCFLGHHRYRPLTDRHDCREYVCIQCGHPLVFRHRTDPYAGRQGFEKKVRYLCGLFGHRVTALSTRNGFTEYGCHCGHTFLEADRDLRKIHHPLVCVLKGHYVRYVTARAGFDEFVCVNCGHPFCFAAPRPAEAV